MDDDERPECSACSGTGEGHGDGSSCFVCRGRGYHHSQREIDEREAAAERRAEEWREDLRRQE